MPATERSTGAGRRRRGSATAASAISPRTAIRVGRSGIRGRIVTQEHQVELTPCARNRLAGRSSGAGTAFAFQEGGGVEGTRSDLLRNSDGGTRRGDLRRRPRGGEPPPHAREGGGAG